MGRYNKSRFQQVMLPRDLVAQLKAIKQSAKESIADVIRRLLQTVLPSTKHDPQPTLRLLTRTDTKNADIPRQDLWGSELFA